MSEEANELPRRSGPPAILSYRELASIREAIARLNEKIDASLAVKADVHDLEARVRVLELDYAKASGTYGIISWVATAGVALIAAVLGAAATLWFK